MTPARENRNGTGPVPGAGRSAPRPDVRVDALPEAGPRTPERGIPEATVARLPIYLRALTALTERGIATCSSEELASAAGVNSAKLRKDLSYLGSYGTRGVGYDVEYLRYQIAREIGVTQDWPVVIVGIGNLGHALANYSGFTSRGFRIVALLDSDPARRGEQVGSMSIRPDDELEAVVDEHDVAIGVIATPAAAAQGVCDRLVRSGVTSILNFAPTVLTVPPGVDVRKVDLSIELQILAYHEQRKAASASGRADLAAPEIADPELSRVVETA
ncbi:MAG TPA: redox-sensing transcriptional repressor Rex [Nocardioidaceae bacterium]